MPRKKTEVKKEETNNDQLTELLKEFNESLKNVNERITSLEEKNKPKAEVRETVNSITRFPNSIMIDEDLRKYPVSQEYRTAVSEVLNYDFEVYVSPRDGATFGLYIIVPQKYSNMPGIAKEVNNVDVRLKILSIAEGVIGVRDYAKKVLNNLGNETAQRILADKAAKSAVTV